MGYADRQISVAENWSSESGGSVNEIVPLFDRPTQVLPTTTQSNFDIPITIGRRGRVLCGESVGGISGFVEVVQEAAGMHLRIQIEGYSSNETLSVLEATTE